MPASKVTDKEFIELWRTHKSAAKVARLLALDQTNVYARRRRLELKHGIKLESDDVRASRFEHLQTAHKHAARHQLGIENGVVIVFSDAHFFPGIRSTAFDALLWAIREMQPKAVIANGDVFDGASISRHPRIGWESKPSVIQELNACVASMSEIEDAAKAARHNVQLSWPLGNHCARFASRLASNAPEYEGVKGFDLKDHFPAWTPCWSAWPTDDVVVKHRFKGGTHATFNNTLTSGKSIITGHLHSLKVTPFNDYGPFTRYGVDTGTLADPDGPQFIDYTEDNPTGWRSGFAVLTFHNGRLLWPELVHKYAPGVVQFRGKLYSVQDQAVIA